MMKRVFDLVMASVALILLAPVMAAIGILVRRDSEGPAFFRQERVGRGGRPFTLLKFRSMVHAPSPEAPLVTSASDARITRVGAKLRSLKLDELPQLINVVRGEMSIVGPRPEVAEYVALWSEEDRAIILSVLPGITDPATLELRREQDLLARRLDPEAFYLEELLPYKAKLYREYVESRSIGGDLLLIVKTINGMIAH